jgi:hypothetical protein
MRHFCGVAGQQGPQMNSFLAGQLPPHVFFCNQQSPQYQTYPVPQKIEINVFVYQQSQSENSETKNEVIDPRYSQKRPLYVNQCSCCADSYFNYPMQYPLMPLYSGFTRTSEAKSHPHFLNVDFSRGKNEEIKETLEVSPPKQTDIPSQHQQVYFGNWQVTQFGNQKTTDFNENPVLFQKNNFNKDRELPVGNKPESTPLLEARNFLLKEEAQSPQSKFVPLKKFKNLYLLLLKFFKSESISITDLEALFDYELEILNLIIIRKYESKLFVSETQKKDIPAIYEELLNYQGKLSIKRPEESYKFVFTRALKYLKKVFKVHYECSAELLKEEKQFYVHYFGSSLDKDSFDLNKYVYPIIEDDQSKKYKSLNLNYFKNVFSCEKFMNDLATYLKTDLRNDYDIEIERKTLQILSKWDSRVTVYLSREGNNSQNGEIPKKLFLEISRYFLQNKRCKLPWTVAEVVNAISRLNSLFSKLINNDEVEIQLENPIS